MTTYYQIVNGKNYRDLTAEDKEMIQNRQTELVVSWQKEVNETIKSEIEEEIVASLKGLIRGIAKRQASKSFSVEQEDFEGIMNLVLVETLIMFDSSLDKPFQPIFLMNCNNAIKMMYRQKSYDLHDTACEIVEIEDFLNQGTQSSEVLQGSKQISDKSDRIEELEIGIDTEGLLDGCFGVDDKKKTIIHMYLEDFKRREIVAAINTEEKAKESVARLVNRTINSFKDYASSAYC